VQRLPDSVTPALLVGGVFDRVVERYLRASTGDGTGRPRPDLVSLWDEEWRGAVSEDGCHLRRVDRETGEIHLHEIDWRGELPERVEHEGRRLAGHEGTPALLDRFIPLPERTAGGGVEPLPALQRRVELRVPGVPVPVVGYVDLITDDRRVVDVETAARAWPDGKARRELQPRLSLAALLQERFWGPGGAPPDGLLFVHLVFVRSRDVRIQEITTAFSPAELLEAVSIVQVAWKGIASGVFVPDPRSRSRGEGCAVYRSGACLGRR
jgi:hypothetical protein